MMYAVNKNKKGVSDVVTTVLIILLVLAAVAIIGGIILRNLGQAGRQINEQVACNSNIVEPVDCKVLSWNDNGVIKYYAKLTVKRTLVASGNQLFSVTANYLNVANVNPGINFQPDLNNLKSNGDTDSTSSSSSNPQISGGKAFVTATYILSDGSSATCKSAPLVCL